MPSTNEWLSISQLIKSFSHDLNNPLSVILGNAELIKLMAGEMDEKLLYGVKP